MTVVKKNQENISLAERMKIARMKKKEERDKNKKEGKGVDAIDSVNDEDQSKNTLDKSKLKTKPKSKVESTNDSKIDLDHMHRLILEMRSDIDFLLTQM